MGFFSRRRTSPSFTISSTCEITHGKDHTVTSVRYFPKLSVWDGRRFRKEHDYLLDSGSDWSIVPFEFAMNHHFELSMVPEAADLIEIGGIGGSREAWLTKRYLRFEKLPEFRF